MKETREKEREVCSEQRKKEKCITDERDSNKRKGNKKENI